MFAGITLLLSVTLFLLVSFPVFAFVPNSGKQGVEKKVVLHPHLTLSEKRLKGVFPAIVKRDSLSHAVRLISLTNNNKSLLRRATKDSYLSAMRRYVTNNQRLLGVGYRDLRLAPVATLINSDLAFFKFDVFRDDIIVEDAALLFRFKQGKLVQVVNQTFSEAEVESVEGDPIPERELQELVRHELGANNYVAGGHSWRVVAKEDRYELVKVKKFRQTLGRESVVQVNVHSGEIFEVAPSRYYFTHGYARAALYPRWYRQEVDFFPLREIGIDFMGGTAVRSVVTDLEGRYSVTGALIPRISRISGAKVWVVNESGPDVMAKGVRDGNSWFTLVDRQGGVAISNDKIVAQSMVFYHIDKVFRVAADYITTPWFDKPLEAHTNVRDVCNAYWSGGASTVNFFSGGRGCANTGLIADVIYHEWGHGLDDKTGGIVDGSFSEGFGDIVSMLITRSHVIGPNFLLAGQPIRDLEPDRVYPRDFSNGDRIHDDGLIIGGAFWDMFKKLKENYSEEEAIGILRKHAFQMIFTAQRFTDVYDALLVIDDDDADLANSTPHYCIINESFSKHGLAIFDRRCLLVSLVKLGIRELHGDANMVIEPGEKIELTPWIENHTGVGMVSLSARGSSDSEHVVWQNSTALWEGIGIGETKKSDVPFIFTVQEYTPCGSEFEMGLDFKIGGIVKHFAKSYRVGRQIGRRLLYQGMGLPAEIPDFGMMETAVVVGGDQWQENTTVYQAHMRVTISHSYLGDLQVSLILPEGREVVVQKLQGKGLGSITIDRDITSLVSDRLGRGEWRLRVTDTERLDRGILHDFVLTLVPKKFVCGI